MASFTELEVWKQARSIRIFVKQITTTFPVEEKFRLTDQIIRSSRSISNNVAEGHGRYNFQDNIRFCIIARGSLSETLDHLIIALDEKLITENTYHSFKQEHDKCLKLLNGYIVHLRNRKTENHLTT